MARPDSTHKTAIKAYGLLSEQPSSVVGIPQSKRSEVVISALTDPQGGDYILSRFGDDIWNLSPFVPNMNTKNGEKTIRWGRIPAAFVDDCKSVLYAYWKLGRPGWALPTIGTLRLTVDSFSKFTVYLESMEIQSLADVQPLHISNFIHQQKSKGLKPVSLVSTFIGIELLHLFESHADNGLKQHPWPGSSASDMAGNVGHGAKRDRFIAKTPLIPEDVQRKLFAYADSILAGADAVLDERDAGIRSAFIDPMVTEIGAACFYLLGCLTGMRSSEISSIKVGAARTELKDGVPFHWLTATEYKTKKGVVEYLMPAMGHDILRIAERFSAPYRRTIRESIAAYEDTIETLGPMAFEKIVAAKANVDCLFLGRGQDEVTPVSVSRWGVKLKLFAKNAGVEWALSPHQLRRLYAYTFVRHRLGNILFLREQFKHSSLSMSQLYAANPHQDAALYDEILEEVHRQKTDLILHWLDSDELLTGGAGEKIMVMRAHDYDSRKALIEETSKSLHIRSTGHSWCLAQDEGCGGTGMYEKPRCGTCGNAVIDKSFEPIWQEIYLHQQELLIEVSDMGQGTAARVKRDLAVAAKVLKGLGVSLDKENANGQSTTN